MKCMELDNSIMMMLFSTGTRLERVGVAGSDPNSWPTGDVGYWIVEAEVGLLLLIGRLWVWHTPTKRTTGRRVGEGFARGRSDA